MTKKFAIILSITLIHFGLSMLVVATSVAVAKAANPSDLDFAFSDYISFALLKAVVSGKPGLRAHFYQQHLMGDGDIFIVFAGQ